MGAGPVERVEPAAQVDIFERDGDALGGQRRRVGIAAVDVAWVSILASADRKQIGFVLLGRWCLITLLMGRLP